MRKTRQFNLLGLKVIGEDMLHSENHSFCTTKWFTWFVGKLKQWVYKNQGEIKQ